MGQYYSIDLRARIVGYVRAGHSARSAARLFGVSAATAVRYAALARSAEDIAPKPQGRPAGKFGKLAPHVDFLLATVRAAPDLTLHELAAALKAERGVETHHSSVDRALARAGWSYKKRLDRRRA
jgi:transposase